MYFVIDVDISYRPMYTSMGSRSISMAKVEVGDKVSYHDMFGHVAFVDVNYFCLQILDEGYCSGTPVRVCVRYDSQYTVHKPSSTEQDALQ